MAAIVNARDVLLQAAATRYVPPEVLGTIDFANVTGATRPADYATKNTITYSASAPASPTDGDIWVDTSVTPNVTRARVSGAWQVSANLTTNTNQLADGANLGGTAAWSGVSGSGKPADNADPTQPTLNAGVTLTAGGLTLSSGGAVKGGKTDYGSGTGFFLGYSGGAYKFDIGNLSNYLRWTGSAISLVGDISGASNIIISGSAYFAGSYTEASISATVYATAAAAGVNGVYGRSTSGAGVYGVSVNANGVYGTTSDNLSAGVKGYSASCVGVRGESGSSTKAAVIGNNTGSGPSVQCVTSFSWGSYTYTAPGGSSTACLHANGTWTDPVTTARVNSAFGVAASGVCQIVVGDTGTCTVSGSGFNLTSSLSGVQCRGTSNIVYIENTSDRRLKEDIKDEELGLDWVLKQRVVSYRMRGKPTTHHGWIYQEVKRHVASKHDALAMLNPSGIGGVDATSMTAVLMRAVQELAERIPVPWTQRVRQWLRRNQYV
jgi:hypothetical protein